MSVRSFDLSSISPGNLKPLQKAVREVRTKDGGASLWLTWKGELGCPLTIVRRPSKICQLKITQALFVLEMVSLLEIMATRRKMLTIILEVLLAQSFMSGAIEYNGTLLGVLLPDGTSLFLIQSKTCFIKNGLAISKILMQPRLHTKWLLSFSEY